MIQLLTSTTAAPRRARRFGRVLADAVRSVVAPAALVKAEATTAPAEPAPVADTPPAKGFYTPEEMPELAHIERACLGYDLAADAARSAERNKRAHKNLLSRLPSGRYGRWLVERKPSNRMTPDLAEIERLLGRVPMRPVAASLVVKLAPADTEAAEAAEQPRELVTA